MSELDDARRRAELRAPREVLGLDAAIAVLRPEDKLVVQLPEGTSDEETQRVTQLLHRELPNRTLVFSSDFKLWVAPPLDDDVAP